MFATSTICTKLLLPVAALLVSAGASLAASTGDTAQSAAFPKSSVAGAGTPAGPGAAGRWLHDEQGRVIGSVRGFTDDGRTAILMIGSYFEFGSHVATVPASDLYIAGGQVRLRTRNASATDTLARR